MKIGRPLIVLILLLVSVTAWAMDIGIFPGEASVEIGAGSPIAAKIVARNEALKQAVTKAIMQTVSPEVFSAKQKAINKSILRKAGNYIQTYEILESRIESGHYILKLEARVKIDLLAADVAKLGVVTTDIKTSRRKILLVTTLRKLDKEKFWPSIFDPLSSRLELIDMEPLPPSKVEGFINSVPFMRYQERSFEEFFDGASQTDARYALIVRSLMTDGQGDICPSLGTARFVDIGNRKVLAKVDFHFQSGVGCEQAAQAAAKEIFAQLADKLKGKGIFDHASVVDLQLQVIGLRGFRDTSKVSAFLRQVPGVKSISLHSFGTGGRVVFRIDYEGSSENLIDAVKRFKPTGFILKKRVTKDDSLLFEAEY